MESYSRIRCSGGAGFNGKVCSSSRAENICHTYAFTLGVEHCCKISIGLDVVISCKSCGNGKGISCIRKESVRMERPFGSASDGRPISFCGFTVFGNKSNLLYFRKKDRTRKFNGYIRGSTHKSGLGCGIGVNHLDSITAQIVIRKGEHRLICIVSIMIIGTVSKRMSKINYNVERRNINATCKLTESITCRCEIVAHMKRTERRSMTGRYILYITAVRCVNPACVRLNFVFNARTVSIGKPRLKLASVNLDTVSYVSIGSHILIAGFASVAFIYSLTRISVYPCINSLSKCHTRGDLCKLSELRLTQKCEPSTLGVTIYANRVNVKAIGFRFGQRKITNISHCRRIYSLIIVKLKSVVHTVCSKCALICTSVVVSKVIGLSHRLIQIIEYNTGISVEEESGKLRSVCRIKSV